MAFLSDAQRKCNFLLSNNPNILTTESSTYNHKSGPDTYDKNQYDIITKIHNTFHTHIPGFNHTTERLINKKQIKYVQQGTPGPGAYIPIQSTNFIDVNKINDTSPQHFLTRSERFKLSNNTITPGPGQYITNYKQFAKYKQQHKIKGNLIYNVNKGIKSNGSDNNNKLKDANVNAVNGDGKDIGPGQYDVCPKWKGNCVDWGKMSIKQVACSIEKEKDNNTTSTNTNSFVNNGDSELNTVFRLRDVIARGQRNNDDIRKVNTRHDIFKQVLQQRKEMYMDSVTKMKNVGTETDKANANTIVHTHNSKKPNTVHSKLHLNHFMDTFQHSNIPSKLYQFFGSSSTRFKTEYNHNGKSINDDTPGPGTYNSIIKQGRIYDININPKKHKQNIQHKVIPGINGLVITSKGNKCLLTTSQSEKNIRSSNSNNNNTTNNNNTRFIKANNFGSSETRFKISSHEIDSITPGPGAYDVNVNNIDTKVNKVKHNQIKQNLHVKLNSHEFKTIKQSSDASFGNCEVNEGSQGKTIQGDLDKYIITEKQVPFGCTADRFKTTTHSKIKNTKHLGPGCYIGQIPFQIKTGQCSMNVPFNSTMPRIALSHKSKDEQCVSNELGPGLYNLDSYYDWNKKSYNVRYVK